MDKTVKMYIQYIITWENPRRRISICQYYINGHVIRYGDYFIDNISCTVETRKTVQRALDTYTSLFPTNAELECYLQEVLRPDSITINEF